VLDDFAPQPDGTESKLRRTGEPYLFEFIDGMANIRKRPHPLGAVVARFSLHRLVWQPHPVGGVALQQPVLDPHPPDAPPDKGPDADAAFRERRLWFVGPFGD
jgi:hypothetical protein